MSKYFRLLFQALVLVLCAASCGKETVEADYSSPLMVTKADDVNAFQLSLTKEHIIRDSQDFENSSFFSASTDGRMSYEKIMIFLHFPRLDKLTPGTELELFSVTFTFPLSSYSGHTTHQITSGKIRFMGQKDNVATLQWEDVKFKVSPFSSTNIGEYLVSGTMQCPVYETMDDYNKASSGQ